MKIAIPVSNNTLCMHFGHCEVFSFFTVDIEKEKIISKENIIPPAHEPGLLPRWIAEQKADVILAGGMGKKAQELFSQNGIDVFVGVIETDPQKAVLDYLKQTLEVGINTCDH